MCKVSVSAVMLFSFFGASYASDKQISEESTSSEQPVYMEVDVSGDENLDLDSLAKSFRILNAACPPATPQKPSRGRAARQALAGAGVRRSLNQDFKNQAERDLKAKERRKNSKNLVRELNLNQVLNMSSNTPTDNIHLPDNTHLLQTHMHNFTNQAPDGIRRPVALRFPSLQDLSNSSSSSDAHQQ